ncbi:8-oxo-dGTP diphosphatase [Poseidonocella pacifica]|uniref:8-oxo-dGTP diphosphatase n=1 Tax=Poseidonocella pacifica TaxID=871651 RepID=A0A1I0XVF0_9RHOB|nr:NUDIX hydrolase [Poseidonocella pacifica]SFB05099.1 8-oxo-dGTP diphosphatase [Poseidonocella pacifica]
MIRRYGRAAQPGRRYVARPGVYAVLERNGRVLLTWQDAPHREFQLPGGGIDPGEHPVAALHREIYEETGWHVGPALRLGAFRRFAYMPEYDLWAEKICTIYRARPVMRMGPPTEPGHKAVWLRPEAAAERLSNSGDRAFLRQALGLG